MLIGKFAHNPPWRTTIISIMAPTHSKPIDDSHPKKRERMSLAECAMNKVLRGSTVFTDEFVNAMADGKKVPLPKSLDDIVVDVDDVGIDWNKILQPVPRKIIKEDDEVKAYNKAIKPAKFHAKYVEDPLRVFDNAEFYSDGEVKCWNCSTSSCSAPSPDVSCSVKHTPSPDYII